MDIKVEVICIIFLLVHVDVYWWWVNFVIRESARVPGHLVLFHCTVCRFHLDFYAVSYSVKLIFPLLSFPAL